MLKQVPRDRIRPGYRLPGALRDRDGHVLLGAGTCVTERDISRLGCRLIVGVYGGEDWPAEDTACEGGAAEVAASDTSWSATESGRAEGTADRGSGRTCSHVETSVLRVGLVLEQDILDASSVLLLAAGTEITPSFLAGLRQRGICSVTLAAPQTWSDGGELQSVHSQEIDALLTAELERPVALRTISPAERPRLPLAGLRAETARGVERAGRNAQILAEMCASLGGQSAVSAGEIRAGLRGFMNLIARDFDLLPAIVAEQRVQEEYLYDHCTNVALLSMAVGAQMGMNREQVVEMGLGAMLQDVGMLRVPESIRFNRGTLTPDERFEVLRHPVHTLDLLERIPGLSAAMRIIGYQAHERDDGSGYPRRRSGMFIHHYAKIVAIADAYTAMTSRRPYRSPMLPYEAAKTLLVDGSRGKFDRTVLRAFLDALSLFPIGSRVALNDGTVAEVVRANPGVHTRPVVAVVDARGGPTDTLIDLSQQTEYRVARALPRPAEAGPAGS